MKNEVREKNERFKLSSLLRTRGSVYCREDSGQEEREVLQSKLVEMYLEKTRCERRTEVQALKFIKNERFSILSRGQ